MNWLHFCLWVSGIYMLYYLIIIFLDLARGLSPEKSASPELSFVQPERVEAEPSVPVPKPSLVASGGVSLKETFGLARQDMLVYTRAVSF